MSLNNSYYQYSHFDSKDKQLICVVCGSMARGYNFGVITCMSCKMFFRRNALTGISKLSCYQGGNCQISPRTKRHCSYCRLLTCFRMGMRRDLIQKKKIPATKKTDIELIRPLDLLRWSDRSQLSNDEWSLLRQLSLIFDSLTDHVLTKAHEIYQQLSTIGIQPLKIRAKASYIYDIADTFAHVVLKFTKLIPHFLFLPCAHQKALLVRNTRVVIMFHSHYNLHLKPIETLTQTPYWNSSMDCLFSSSNRYLHHKLNYLVGLVSFIDPCLIKLILVILTFSTNNLDHDDLTSTHQLNEYYHTLILNKIQNIYIDLMWKYMIYRFGEERTIYLFSNIIKTILHAQDFVYLIENSKTSSEQKFDKNIEKITDQVLRLDFQN